MKLHWSPRSPFVRKVMVFALETGLASRLEKVRSVVAMRSPNAALMRDNPLNKLPTLVLEDGRVLYDSAVICEYLDSLHGGKPRFPRAGDARWLALRRQALGDGLLELHLLWRVERDQAVPERSQPLLDAFALKSKTSLAALEKEAAALRAAADFDIGVMALACAVNYLDFRFTDLDWRAGHPALADWLAGINARPSMRETVPVDDQ